VLGLDIGSREIGRIYAIAVPFSPFAYASRLKVFFDKVYESKAMTSVGPIELGEVFDKLETIGVKAIVEANPYQIAKIKQGLVEVGGII
jgi:hypothetical protein